MVKWKERISAYLPNNQCRKPTRNTLNVQDLQVKQQLFKKTKATGTDTDSMLKSVICSSISDSLKHKVDQESLGGYIRSRLLWIDTQNRFPSLRE